MNWDRMHVTITDRNGDVFSTHDIGPVSAAGLQHALEAGKSQVAESPDTELDGLLHALDEAADNTARGAVTDENNLIISEKG